MLTLLNKKEGGKMREYTEEESAFLHDCQAKVTEALLAGEVYEFTYDLDQVVDYDVSMKNAAQAAEWYLTTAHAETFNKLLGHVMADPSGENVCKMRHFYIKEMAENIAERELCAYEDGNHG